MVKAEPTLVGSPARKPRAASRIWVNGLRRATVSIQPESKLERHEDRRQKQYEEDRRAYNGTGLLGAE